MEDFNKPSYRNLKSFENLCGKIACLTFPRTNEEIKVLNQLLDDLISLDYNLFCVKKEVLKLKWHLILNLTITFYVVKLIS